MTIAEFVHAAIEALRGFAAIDPVVNDGDVAVVVEVVHDWVPIKSATVA
jgi:hypothetical protein